MEQAGYVGVGILLTGLVAALAKAIHMLATGAHTRRLAQNTQTYEQQREVRRDTIGELYGVIDLLKKRVDSVEKRADVADHNHAECEKRNERCERRSVQMERAMRDAGIHLPPPDETGVHRGLGDNTPVLKPRADPGGVDI